MSVVMMARVLRRVASLQTVRRWKSDYKSEDFFKHEAVEKHIKRVLDEHQCVSSRLEREHVSESERKGLNHKLVHLSRVVDAFERTQHAMREERDIDSLIHSKSDFHFIYIFTSNKMMYRVCDRQCRRRADAFTAERGTYRHQQKITAAEERGETQQLVFLFCTDYNNTLVSLYHTVCVCVFTQLIETLVHTDDNEDEDEDGKNVILEVAAGRTTGGL